MQAGTDAGKGWVQLAGAQAAYMKGENMHVCERGKIIMCPAWALSRHLDLRQHQVGCFVVTFLWFQINKLKSEETIWVER